MTVGEVEQDRFGGVQGFRDAAEREPAEQRMRSGAGRVIAVIGAVEHLGEAA